MQDIANPVSRPLARAGASVRVVVEVWGISSIAWQTNYATTTGTNWQDPFPANGGSSGYGYHYRVSAVNSEGASSPPSAAFPAPRYVLVPLGPYAEPFPGNFPFQMILNNQGTVVYTHSPDFVSNQIYRWKNGLAQLLTTSDNSEEAGTELSIDDNDNVASNIYYPLSNSGTVNQGYAIGLWGAGQTNATVLSGPPPFAQLGGAVMESGVSLSCVDGGVVYGDAIFDPKDILYQYGVFPYDTTFADDYIWDGATITANGATQLGTATINVSYTSNGIPQFTVSGEYESVVCAHNGHLGTESTSSTDTVYAVDGQTVDGY